MRKIGNALFNYMVNDAASVTLVTLIIRVGHGASDAKGIGVEWCLRDKAVGERNTEQTGDACSEA